MSAVRLCMTRVDPRASVVHTAHSCVACVVSENRTKQHFAAAVFFSSTTIHSILLWICHTTWFQWRTKERRKKKKSKWKTKICVRGHYMSATQRPMSAKFNSQCLVKFVASSEYTMEHICHRSSVRRIRTALYLSISPSIVYCSRRVAVTVIATVVVHTHNGYYSRFFCFSIFIFFRIHLELHFSPRTNRHEIFSFPQFFHCCFAFISGITFSSCQCA